MWIVALLVTISTVSSVPPSRYSLIPRSAVRPTEELFNLPSLTSTNLPSFIGVRDTEAANEKTINFLAQ